MFLSDSAVDWINVAENKVQLYVVSALVGSEHDRVRRYVTELEMGNKEQSK